MQLDTKETYCEGQDNFNVIVTVLKNIENCALTPYLVHVILDQSVLEYKWIFTIMFVRCETKFYDFSIGKDQRTRMITVY